VEVCEVAVDGVGVERDVDAPGLVADAEWCEAPQAKPAKSRHPSPTPRAIRLELRCHVPTGQVWQNATVRAHGGADPWRSSVSGRWMVDNPRVSAADLHEEEVESRYEATVAVLIVIGLQVALAFVSLRGERKLVGLPGWLWLIPVVPEAALLVALAFAAPRHRLEQMGRRRTVALTLDAVITVANALALAALISSLLRAQEKSGGALLAKGLAIWGTNVITFGLLFWEFDRGGPIRRRAPDPPPRDFQFPQDENPTLAEPGWYPRLVDYIYVSYTNAIAFSPTDVMPLTRRVKMMMLAESAISATTVLLVAARAVNILR
jgi:hypothetical protein